MQRFQPFLFKPIPSEVGFDLDAMVEEVRAAFFAEIEDRYEVRIGRSRGSPLACIWYNLMGRGQHVIYFHPVLNHPGTPREVLAFIAKHELTHAVRPDVSGQYDGHPPEFWEHEFRVGPERFAAWHWIYENVGACLRRDRGRLRVRRQWRTLQPAMRTPYTPHLPFEGNLFEQYCPEGGAQMRLPPDWATRPAPMGEG